MAEQSHSDKPGISGDGRPFNIADKYRDIPVKEIRDDVIAKSLGYTVMALNIHGCLNIGNLMRTVNLCGARKFIIFGRRKYDSRGCVGAQHYIDMERVDAIRDADKRDFTDENLVDKLAEDDYILDEQVFMDYIIRNNYLPVFIEQDQFSKPATDYNITSIIYRAQELAKLPCFILGNESFGIPRNILDTRGKFELSYTLELKQKGSIRSHNVANCGAILCYKVMECFEDI
jgi:tRNA G18 (ribose-2'-O)-methylase SpoU